MSAKDSEGQSFRQVDRHGAGRMPTLWSSLKVVSSVLLVGSVLTFAGCGGEDTDSTFTAPDPPTSANEQENDQQLDSLLQNTYDVARDVCASSGIKKVAREFGVSASDPEEVADAYANGVSTGEHVQASRNGCLEGLEGAR